MPIIVHLYRYESLLRAFRHCLRSKMQGQPPVADRPILQERLTSIYSSYNYKAQSNDTLWVLRARVLGACTRTMTIVLDSIADDVS